MTNAHKAAEMKDSLAPFIALDVETTGAMQGHGDVLTQVALSYFDYNYDEQRYELQDYIFLLSKADPLVLESIEKAKEPTDENAYKYIANNYFYEINKKITYVENKLNKLSETQQELEDFKKKLEDPNIDSKERSSLKQKIIRRENAIEKINNFDTSILSMKDMSIEEICKTPEFKAYFEEKREAELNKLKEMPPLDSVLSKQGIDKNKWLENGDGLTNGEMAIGVSEFIKKYYQTNLTYIITNGSGLALHYLQKANINIPALKEDRNGAYIINSYQIAKEVAQVKKALDKENLLGNKQFFDLQSFAIAYQKTTGEEIKTFDALTKSLCLGEMAGEFIGEHVILNSVERLSNSVKCEAFALDEKYSMSSARAASMAWIPTNTPTFRDKNTFIFDSLKYVEFGNDRRYIDLDSMFEQNSNFEITLAGEKEPIKSWDELESKIKALNAHISPELLEDIKAKYEEVKTLAEHEKEEYEHNQAPISLFNIDYIRQLNESSFDEYGALDPSEDVLDDLSNDNYIDPSEEKETDPFTSQLEEFDKQMLEMMQLRSEIEENIVNSREQLIQKFDSELYPYRVMLDTASSKAVEILQNCNLSTSNKYELPLAIDAATLNENSPYYKRDLEFTSITHSKDQLLLFTDGTTNFSELYDSSAAFYADKLKEIKERITDTALHLCHDALDIMAKQLKEKTMIKDDFERGLE